MAHTTGSLPLTPSSVFDTRPRDPNPLGVSPSFAIGGGIEGPAVTAPALPNAPPRSAALRALPPYGAGSAGVGAGGGGPGGSAASRASPPSDSRALQLYDGRGRGAAVASAAIPGASASTGATGLTGSLGFTGSGATGATSALASAAFNFAGSRQAGSADVHARSEAEELMRRVEQRKAMAQAASATAPLAPRPTAGRTDRPIWDTQAAHTMDLQPSQLAPTRPASPSVSATQVVGRAPLPDMDVGELPKEVSANEVELSVLRAELEAKEGEAARLRQRVREAELELQQASGNVGALSAKVEVNSSSEHAVLEASAKHIEAQVQGLKRRLARAEWELSEKDEEISALRQKVSASSKHVEEQRGILQALHRSRLEHGQQTALREEDRSRLQRHKAMGEWRDRVQAQLSQEEQCSRLAKERRDRERQIDAIDQEMAKIRTAAHRFDELARRHASEMRALEQRLSALQLEERLHTSAAKLGSEAVSEQLQELDTERRTLEARLKQEIARKTAKAPDAAAYDSAVAEATRHQEQLEALVACTHEISRVLQDHRAGHGPWTVTAPSASTGVAPYSARGGGGGYPAQFLRAQ